MRLISFRGSTAICAAATVIGLAQSARAASIYVQTNLTSDGAVPAANIDPNLKNPWGVSFGPTSPFWVSDQVTGVTTLYTGKGVPIALVPTIPGGNPTGQVFNSAAGSGAFALPASSGGTVPSLFIFDTLGGTIAGWNPGSTGGAGAAVTTATKTGGTYTGLAIGSIGASNYIYAANAAGGIEVYDSSFTDVTGTTFSGKFVDPNPAGSFTPYGIQNIDGNIYVTYATLGMSGGYVDEFDTSGNFIRRIATNGPLDAPWGLTLAPSNFGSFSGDLLVGNFGSGEIDAFNPSNNFAFAGALSGTNGQPLVNSGLWALDFGNGGPGFNPDALYFTAGINNQKDGLFGSIQYVPEPSAAGTVAIGLLLILPLLRRISRNPAVF